MNDLRLDVGLANELKMSFRRNGWTEEQVKEATKGDFLAQVRRVLLGQAEITVPEHAIDLDADPFVLDGWKVEEHRKGGQFIWNTVEVALHLSKKQVGGKYIEGNKLRKELEDKSVLNANVLDYLLANQHLIPEEWKEKVVFFWGTICRDPSGFLCVRYLYWRCGRWHWGAHWLGGGWGGDDPALVSRK